MIAQAMRGRGSLVLETTSQTDGERRLREEIERAINVIATETHTLSHLADTTGGITGMEIRKFIGEYGIPRGNSEVRTSAEHRELGAVTVSRFTIRFGAELPATTGAPWAATRREGAYPGP